MNLLMKVWNHSLILIINLRKKKKKKENYFRFSVSAKNQQCRRYSAFPCEEKKFRFSPKHNNFQKTPSISPQSMMTEPVVDHSDKNIGGHSKKRMQAECVVVKMKKDESQMRFIFFYHIAEHKYFEWIVSFIIIINSITLGIFTNRNTQNQALETLFFFFYIEEVMIKLLAYDTKAFWTKFWNVFDFVIANVCIADMIAQNTGDGEGFSIARIFRMLRIARLVKLMNVFEPLQNLLVGIRKSLKPMSGAVFGLFFIFYMAGIFCTIYLGHDYLLWKDGNGTEKLIDAWFGTVLKSMHTLFQIMILEGWSMDICRPVCAIKPEAWLFFIPFICLTTFAFLNIITGIAVDSTMKACEQGLAKLKHQQQILPTLNHTLEKMDTDGDGELSLSELEKALNNQKLRQRFESLGVHPEDIRDLFHTFDLDRSGTVDYHEFIAEFLTLSATAKKKRHCSSSSEPSKFKNNYL